MYKILRTNNKISIRTERFNKIFSVGQVFQGSIILLIIYKGGGKRKENIERKEKGEEKKRKGEKKRKKRKRK